MCAVMCLTADAQLLDQRLVTIGIGPFQIVQQAAALANHQQQPTARAMGFTFQGK